MASLNELAALAANDNLRNKVCAGLLVIAEEVRVEDAATTNHAERVVLSARVLRSPTQFAGVFVRAMLAYNASVPAGTIQSIADAADDTGDNAILNAIRGAWNIIALHGV